MRIYIRIEDAVTFLSLEGEVDLVSAAELRAAGEKALTHDCRVLRINLAGVYSMDGQQFDFVGRVFTQASLPHMVASRWKSLLLRPISPFFKGADGGAEIPVKITGTKSAPKFGLDLFRKDKAKDSKDEARKH